MPCVAITSAVNANEEHADGDLVRLGRFGVDRDYCSNCSKTSSRDVRHSELAFYGLIVRLRIFLLVPNRPC